MKKKSVICLAVLLVVGMLSGCGKDADKTAEENSTSAQTTASAEQETSRLNVSDLKVADYVTLGEYKNLDITVNAIAEVTDEQVQTQALQWYQGDVTADNGGVKDRAVATGDTVIIDYVGKKDGVAFDGGTATGADLTIGSGQYIDGFEDGLIGVMPGETVDLNLTFPENYQSTELAGAEVVFTVTVQYILPTEMQDEVVAGFGYDDFSNVEGLLQYTRDYLEEQALSTYEDNLWAALLSTLVQNSTYSELPQDLVAQYEQQITENIQYSAAMYGLDADTLVYYMYNTTLDSYVTAAAEGTTQQILAAFALAEKEQLGLTEEELDEQITVLAEQNGWESAEVFLQYYDREQIRESVMVEKVIDYLKENSNIINQ